jgi:TrmH family RNA methyltransferase
VTTAGVVEFVLVEPEHPGNVGSSARALLNMGFAHLVVVDPVGSGWVDHDQARAMACAAKRILHSARVVSSADDALSSSHRIIGTTRRHRDERGPDPVPIEQLSGSLIRSVAAGETVSILFGPEDRGLSAADLARCHELVTIPTAPESPSLNLAQAVLLVAYELHRSLGSEESVDLSSGPLPAEESEVRGLLEHAKQALICSGSITSDTPAGRFETLRRLLLRRRPNTAEVKLLRGLFRLIEKSAEADR